jgi:hypothetical protein
MKIGDFAAALVKGLCCRRDRHRCHDTQPRPDCAKRQPRTVPAEAVRKLLGLEPSDSSTSSTSPQPTSRTRCSTSHTTTVPIGCGLEPPSDERTRIVFKRLCLARIRSRSFGSRVKTQHVEAPAPKREAAESRRAREDGKSHSGPG